MSYSRDKHKETATVADSSVTSDLLTFTPAFPAEVVEIGFVVTTAFVDAAGGLVLGADLRPTAGSDAGRVTGGAGTMTLTSAQANKAAGKVMRSRPVSPLVVLPGQQVVLKQSAAVDSGAGLAYIVFREALQGDSTVETVVIA